MQYMNLNCKTIALPVLLATVAYSTPYAQTKVAKYEIGINAGTLIYQGDLSTHYIGSFHYLKPAIGVFASRAINKNLAIRANLVLGKISDDESVYSSPAYKRQRNFKFNTSITEFSALLVWNVLGKSTDESDRRIVPYLFGGAGISFLNVHRDWSNFNRTAFPPTSSIAIGLAADSAHSLPGAIPAIPIGAGIRYAIGPKLSLAGEFNYRFVFTDYLDGFSQSVNPNSKDKYYGISIGLIYSFINNSGIDCPKVGK